MKSRESANDFSGTQIWKTLKLERSYEKLFPNLIKKVAISGVLLWVLRHLLQQLLYKTGWEPLLLNWNSNAIIYHYKFHDL